MKTPAQHIPFEKLTDLAVERLDTPAPVPSDRPAELSHLSTCTRCASQLQHLQNVVLLMKTDREPDAPRDLIAYAVNMFDRGRESRIPSALRHLVAALTFDSSVRQTPVFGVRSGQLTAWQLVYSAEGNDVDVRITPEQDEWVVEGQVLGRECVGGEVNLINLVRVDGGDKVAVAVLSELCEFSFPPVPAGNYKLLLRLDDIEVEIPRLEIRA